MNKKTIRLIVAVLVIVIVIAGAAAYLLSNNGNGGTTNTTPTPTPVSVAGAATLTFSANVTSQGQTTTYTWAGTNLTAVMTLRVNFATYAYILDASQQKSWMSSDSGTTWTVSTFATDWGTAAAQGFGKQWADYLAQLVNWSGSGDYAYTNIVGENIVLFNIIVNPTIPASTFTTS